MGHTMKESVGGSPLFSCLKSHHPCSISGLPCNPTAVLHIPEECGVSPSGCLLWRTCSPGDDGRMSGHNWTSGEGRPAVVKGTQMEVTSSPALCCLDICLGSRGVMKEK